MKFLAPFIFILLFACQESQQEIEHPEIENQSLKNFSIVKKETKVEITNFGSEVLVNLPNENEAYYLQSERKVNLTNLVIENAFILETKRSIFIIDRNNEMNLFLFRLGVNTKNKDQSRKIKLPGFGNSDRNNKARIIECYGIAKIESSISKKDLLERYTFENGRIAEECDNGGPGSNACSVEVSYPFMTDNCDVQCDPGYYACCQREPLACTCILDGSGTGDGTGGSGNGDGEISCSIVDAYFVGAQLIIVVLCQTQ